VADIHVKAGDFAAALEALERLDASLAERGEHAHRLTIQAKLADVRQRLGDRDAARAAIAFSDELSADEDVINYAITHRIRARLALAEGDGSSAESWARSAVRYAYMTDFVGDHALARLELASVLAGLGRRGDAEIEAHEALAVRRAKGDRPGVAEAQAFLSRL
jgi:hypothetical protein